MLWGDAEAGGILPGPAQSIPCDARDSCHKQGILVLRELDMRCSPHALSYFE